MSEEFEMSVSFEFNHANQISEFETLLEHLDLYEYDEAQHILDKYSLKKAMGQFSQLTSKHCHYQPNCNLLEMYTGTFDENVDDLDVEFNQTDYSGKIVVSGKDNEALDFCSALVLLLIAMESEQIQAQAGCDYWRSQWQTNDTGIIEFSLSVLEEDE